MLKIYVLAYLVYRGLSGDPDVINGYDLVAKNVGEELCMDESKLIEQLKIHEGVKLMPYKDTEGKWTIGIGRNLSDRGISMATAEQMLTEDIILAKSELDKIYPEWCDLTEARQMVLANMMFNMGLPSYSTFKNFWAALKAGQYDLAADEMMDSKWSKQVKNRAVELSGIMRRG